MSCQLSILELKIIIALLPFKVFVESNVLFSFSNWTNNLQEVEMMPRCKDAKMPRCQDTKTERHKDIKIQRYKDTKILRCRDESEDEWRMN
jgi:hypothetical protein